MSNSDLSTKTVIFVLIARIIYWCFLGVGSFGLSSDIVNGEFSMITVIMVLALAAFSYPLIQYVFKHKKNRINDYVIIATSVIIGVLGGSTADYV